MPRTHERAGWRRAVVLLSVLGLAPPGLGCVPRAADGQGELVELPRGLSGAEVIARMGRAPDEIHRLGGDVEDWVYVDPELERSFVLRMRGDRLRWSKMIAQAGTRY